MALTSRARRSIRSGRVCSLSFPCGSRILRDRFEAGLCQEIERTSDSVAPFVDFIEMRELVSLDLDAKDELGQRGAIKPELLVTDSFV